MGVPHVMRQRARPPAADRNLARRVRRPPPARPNLAGTRKPQAARPRLQSRQHSLTGRPPPARGPPSRYQLAESAPSMAMSASKNALRAAMP